MNDRIINFAIVIGRDFNPHASVGWHIEVNGVWRKGMLLKPQFVGERYRLYHRNRFIKYIGRSQVSAFRIAREYFNELPEALL